MSVTRRELGMVAQNGYLGPDWTEMSWGDLTDAERARWENCGVAAGMRAIYGGEWNPDAPHEPPGILASVVSAAVEATVKGVAGLNSPA